MRACLVSDRVEVFGDDCTARERGLDLLVVRAARSTVEGLPAGADRIYLIDPLGNTVLAFPRDPDIKKVAKDIERVLRASRIG